ncbi:MAG: DUF4190 domain-containing protein [Mycobacteriales bacterium]
MPGGRPRGDGPHPEESSVSDQHPDHDPVHPSADETAEPDWGDDAVERRPPAPRNGTAIASLVLGVISVPGIYLLGLVDLPVALLAVVLGFLALRQTRRGLATKRGFAIGGMVGGGIGLVLVVVALILSHRLVNDCRDKIGHAPSSSELKTCASQRG